MCQVAKCCCCCSLKAGLYIAVGYTATICVIVIAVLAWLLRVTGSISARDLYPEGGLDQYDHGVTEAAIDMVRIMYIVALVIYALWLLFALIMPCGVGSKKRGYLVPWIVMTWIINALIVLGFVNLIRNYVYQRQPIDSGLYYQLFPGVTILLLNIFCLCAVTSLYKNNMKEHNEIYGAYMSPQGVPPPPYEQPQDYKQPAYPQPQDYKQPAYPQEYKQQEYPQDYKQAV